MPEKYFLIKHWLFGHIMIWGCMFFNGSGKMSFIEDNMNAIQYIDTLWDNLCNSALILGIPDLY